MASITHEGILSPLPLQSSACSEISCNDEFIALKASLNEIGIWKWDELNENPVLLRRHIHQVTCVCLGHQKNPTYLCTASEDGIYIWQMEATVFNYRTGIFTEPLQIAKDLGICNDLCFSHDDSLVSACIEDEVWIINVENCELVATLSGYISNVTASIFCPHQVSTLVTISEDRSFKIWDIDAAVLLYQSSVISSSSHLSIAMHPEHMHFSIGSSDGKIRVFDLISHRCIHEVEVSYILAKADFPQEGYSQSSERLGKLKNEEHGIYDAEFERSHAVLRLTYWKADSSFITEAKENGTGTLLKRDSTVREVLKEPAMLIAGCMSHILLFDSNTMNTLYLLDLMEPMLCANGLDSIEYCISSAGYFAFSSSDDNQKVHCIIGSFMEKMTHILRIQPKRTNCADIDSSDSYQLYLDDQSDYADSQNAIEPQISVLSRAALVKGSPLCSVLEPKQKDPKGQKGVRTAKNGKQLNQPLTFKTKVKSSGYSEAPRSAMFQPKTNGATKKSASVMSSSSKRKEKLGMSSCPLSDVYPTKSDPPVNFEKAINLLPVQTAISSLRFSANGKRMSCALGDKNAYVLNIPYIGKVSSFVGHDNVVNSAEISHDNSLLLTASDDRTAKIWTQNQSSPLLNISKVKHNMHAEKVTPISEQDNHEFPKEVAKAAFYFIDKFVLLSCLNSLYLYNYNIEETKSDIKRYQKFTRYKLVKKYRIDDVQQITTFSCINGFYSYIVLAACSDKSLAVFDMNYGKIVRRMQDVHGRIVHTICQNQGSAYVTHPSEAYDLFLTSAASDGIKLWDLRTDRCVRKYNGHVNRSHVVGAAFSPCSRFFATGSEDRSTYVFDIRNSAYLHRLTGHSDVVNCVDFHPAKPMLATGSLDGKLHFYKEL